MLCDKDNYEVDSSIIGYLCDHVVFCHGLPSLVHCNVQWGIGESISYKIVSCFEAVEAAAHRKSHS